VRLNEKALAARGRQRNLVGLIGVLALLLLSVAGFKSYSDLRVGSGQEEELRQQIAVSEERLAALQHRLERLRQDPAMLERLAREELLMARPGEVVIVLPQEARTIAEAKTRVRDGEAGGG
jgi:cell division protein FtsB